MGVTFCKLSEVIVYLIACENSHFVFPTIMLKYENVIYKVILGIYTRGM